MSKTQEYIEKGEKYLLKTYNRYPVVLDRGEGVYLFDVDGKKYLDFGAGIAVFALGYGTVLSSSFYQKAAGSELGK